MTIGIVEGLQSLQNGFLDFFFNMVSYLGEETIYMLVFATIYYGYSKKAGEFLAFTLFFTGVFNNTLKTIVDTPRPFQKYPDRVTNLRPSTSTGTSFPSGHTQNFTAFWFGFAYWFKKKWLFIVAMVLSVLMALSRMYLGVHFLEDVLASIVLGIGTAYVISRFFDKTDMNKVYIVISLVFLPFLFIFQSEDLFKGYGLFVGFTAAMFIEKNYVNFSLDVSIKKKAIRIIVGLVVMLVIQLGFGVVFDMIADEGTTMLMILDMFRYGLIALVSLGLYPMLFNRFNF